MKRTQRLTVGLVFSLIVIAAVSASLKTDQTRAEAAKPNILFLLTDDLDLKSISVMPHLKTLLIDQGMSASNYFVSVSLCCPSRTTTLRGQYSHNTGVETNGGSNGGFQTAHKLGVEKDTIATWLKAGGYRTGLFGKYLNGYPNTAADNFVPPGWDTWFSAAKGGNPYSEFNYVLNENGTLKRYGAQPEDYGTDVYTQKVANFITASAKDNQPFFAYLAVYAPHQPATPAPRHATLFSDAKAPRTPSYNESDVSDKPQFIQRSAPLSSAVQNRIDDLYRKRLQSLQAVDESVQKLIETLKSNGQLENTYFVFTSDNGFHLGQHRMPSGKQTAYEEDIHLPLIVRGPGIPAGQTLEPILGNVDLAPTFADWAGVKTAQFVDGRSFAPLLRTKPSPVGAWRQAYLVEHWQDRGTAATQQANDGTSEPADADQRGTPGSEKPGSKGIPEFHGLRTKEYTYVEYITGERELYDLRRDPNQLENIAGGAPANLIKTLSARLAVLRNCKAQMCRTAEEQTLELR
jgi:N-acetylglucosamine-6-sulfatase